MTSVEAWTGPAISHVRVAVATARGSRRDNEDAVGISGWVVTADSGSIPVAGRPPTILPLQLGLTVTADQPLLIAVADGMGGRPGGARAARIAAEALTRLPPDGVGTAAAMFALAHQRVKAEATGADEGMGCGAALFALQANGRATVSNVGDVRAYRLVDGYAGQLTVDDRITGDGDDDDIHAGVVTQAVGGSGDQAAPHYFSFPVRPGDQFILCTDGVHDALDDSIIAEQAGTHYIRTARTLIRSALTSRRYRGDNATVVVIEARLTPPGRSGRALS